jgi:hypothetical protein
MKSYHMRLRSFPVNRNAANRTWFPIARIRARLILHGAFLFFAFSEPLRNFFLHSSKLSKLPAEAALIIAVLAVKSQSTYPTKNPIAPGGLKVQISVRTREV